jgi:ferredoxin
MVGLIRGVKVSIDPARCQGHGRCYELAPEVFSADDEGYGEVPGTGEVAGGLAERARLAALNCPESAVDVDDGEPVA